MDQYEFVFLGLWLILSTIVFQATVFIRAHRRTKGYKVGVMDSSLGQDSFLFRSYRTFWNSLENIVPLFGMSVIAVLSGYNAETLNIIVWIFAITRIIHMLLYYFIATEKMVGFSLTESIRTNNYQSIIYVMSKIFIQTPWQYLQ